MELTAGTQIAPRALHSIRNQKVALPDARRLTHLQFRRYAGCPVCNLHLRHLAQRHDDLLAAGIQEMVVFHSPAAVMVEHQGLLPFVAIADPDRLLYGEFGVERNLSPLDALRPRSWRAARSALSQTSSWKGITGKGESKVGLPAEFLIDSDGWILDVHYGNYVDDHWSVDELLHRVQAATANHPPLRP